MKNKLPFFTVIVPTYNRVFYLKQAIDSVINQSFKDWELHIVDNTSTDGTKEYLNQLVNKDNRIKFSTIQNNGIIAFSRNYALKRVKTKAVSFLDDDDIWLKDKLINDYDILKNREGFIYSKCYSFKNQKKIIRTLPIRKIPKNNAIYDLLHYGNIFTTSVVSYSLNKYTRDILFNESKDFRTWEDYDLWFRLIKDGKLIPYMTKKYGAKYRISDSQYSSPKQDIKNTLMISNYFKKYYFDYKLKIIDDLPLWGHYSNMISFCTINNFNKTFISFLKTCLLSIETLDFLFLLKTLTKFFILFINKFLKKYGK